MEIIDFVISNNEIKRLTSLQKKKYRTIYNSFLIEGEKLIHDALEVNFPMETIFISPNYNPKGLQELLEQVKKKNIEVCEISEKQLQKISYVKTPQPILAIGKIVKYRNNINVFVEKWNNVLILNQIQDPGNLGTLIRTADWFGVNGIIMDEGCADIYGPKVVRGSMGSIFRVPIITEANIYDTIPLLKQNNIKTFSTDMNGIPVSKLNPIPEKWALFLGNEGQGLPAKLNEKTDKIISIPGNGKTDSLNVAISGAIILYHLTQL